jgi:NADPH2:quinone reductase
VQRITGGKGVDVILDMVAGSYVAREVRCLAEDGRLVIIAVQGGSRRVQCRPGAAPPPDGDRLHAAPAPGPSRRHRQALRDRVWPLLEPAACAHHPQPLCAQMRRRLMR